MYVAYAAPHFPLQAREEDIAKYRGRFAAGWDELRAERYELDNTIVMLLSDNGACAEKIDLGQALGGGVARAARRG
jgi:hypothetical protein